MPGATLAFSKVEGTTNDFVLVDLRDRPDAVVQTLLLTLAEQAARICDRRRGVGADGILVVTRADYAADPNQDIARRRSRVEDERATTAGGSAHVADVLARMIVLNADGSRPEMCGNGLRCVALHIAHSAGARPGDPRRRFGVLSDAGPRSCTVEISGGVAHAVHGEVEVDMGPAQRGAERRPAVAPGRIFYDVSLGNPHAVHFVGDDEDPRVLASALGPAIEVDAAYPDRTNVEFARATASEIELWVWERGCGLTGACGTGACATAAAGVDRGLFGADTPILVQLPGGPLSISVPADASRGVVMRGPARVVYVGSLAIEA